jgi:hypothetical protein
MQGPPQAMSSPARAPHSHAPQTPATQLAMFLRGMRFSQRSR